MEQQPDYTQLLRIAQSPAGQKLLALLQRSGGEALSSAASKASGGDYTAAKALLSSLLASPEAQRLLQELEDTQK